VELFRDTLCVVEKDRDLAIIAFLGKFLCTLFIIDEDRDELRVALGKLLPVGVQVTDVFLAVGSILATEEHDDQVFLPHQVVQLGPRALEAGDIEALGRERLADHVELVLHFDCHLVTKLIPANYYKDIWKGLQKQSERESRRAALTAVPISQNGCR
jgi:hypothetical protein